jgi:hypothetical protein
VSEKVGFWSTRARPIALNFIGLILLGAAGFMTGMTVSARMDAGNDEPANATRAEQRVPLKAGPDVIVQPNRTLPAYHPPAPQI